MKETFLERFMKKNAWEGEFWSKEHIVSLDGIIEYFHETSELANEFPQQLDCVISDNKNLVLQHVLPLPPKLYEQLLLGVVEDMEEGCRFHWQQPNNVTFSRIVDLLVKRKAGCLAAYESKVRSKVNNYESYTSGQECSGGVDQEVNSVSPSGLDNLLTRSLLRNLRNNIYFRIHNQLSTYWQMRKYSSATKDFIERYESELSVTEIATLDNRVKVTANAISYAKLRKNKHLADQKLNIKLSASKVQVPELFSDTLSETGESELDLDSETSERVITEVTVTTDFNNVPAVKSDTKDLIDIKHSDNMLAKLLILPDVPDDSTDSDAKIFGDELDVEIRRRLTRLKFFSQTWALNKEHPTEPMSQPLTMEVVAEVANPSMGDGELHESSEVISANSSESEDCLALSMELCRLTKYLPRVTPRSVLHKKEVYIRETLDMICDTYCDTSYIDMANDLVDDPDIVARDMVSSCDVDHINEAQQLNRTMTTSETRVINTNEFLKLQEDELLATLYNYQVYTVGLVIVSNFMSAKLSQIMTLLQTLQSSSDTPFISTSFSPTPETVPADLDPPVGTCSKLWNHLKPFNFISDGKKVDQMDKVKTSVAIEATEFPTILN